MSRPSIQPTRIVMLGLIGWSVWSGSLGCQTTAPMHLWAPAKLAPVGQKSVVLMEIKGPKKTSLAIRDELLAQTDRREKHQSTDRRAAALSFVLPEQMPSEPTIALVSSMQMVSNATPESCVVSSANEPYPPNENAFLAGLGTGDLAVAAAARTSGMDQLLHGEIIFATGQEDSAERLAIVWRLVGLTPEANNAGIPIAVDQDSVAARHPDLMKITDPRERLRKAMVRETLALLTSSVHRQPVTLANPRGTLGSRAVRQGNRLAEQGNWPAAEDRWVATMKRYPGKTSAWINAAIAAAARQDFVGAKARATRAVTLAAFDPINRSLAEKTLVWIELRQRDYHDAFGIPDPREGWQVSRSP